MIADYFNRLSDKVAAAADLGGVSPHRPDIGLNRETTLRDVLNRHLPDRLRALLGGVAIGLDGAHSKQLDVIVRADNTPRFEEHDRSIIAVESLVGVITVKSKLDRPALHDALDNLGSIPQLSKDVFSFRFLQPTLPEVFLLKHPSTYIYAFDGPSVESCLAALEEYFDTHQVFPKNRIPRELVVHGRYMISYSDAPTETKDGTPVPAASFWPSTIDTAHRGIPLARIINYLYSYISWMPFLEVDFHKYINAAYDFPPDTV